MAVRATTLRRALALAAALAVIGLAPLARAQAPAPAAGGGDKVEYKKKTLIDLTGATIEGELTKPEGSYIVNRKLSKFSTLIQARSDYVPELLTSHNEL